MILPLYLAMTASETRKEAILPSCFAWMACHFSSAHRGLSNLPDTLPKGALLMVDDWIEPDGHDPKRISNELSFAVDRLSLKGVVLDFQRPNNPETLALCAHLTATLPCPVGVSEQYARELSCPVFLSSPDLYTPLEKHVKPWQGREIWLEAALEAEDAIITQSGYCAEAGTLEPLQEPWHKEDAIFCRYHWEQAGQAVCFSLQRTKEDLFSMLEKAGQFGISLALGLYRQLYP